MSTQRQIQEPASDWPERLLAHYRTRSRDLPWRRTTDPYAIYVSEIMLQQTQVQTVIPYYERFLARFPNLDSLASADPDEVHKLWEGLGYYARVRQMQEAARQIVAHVGSQMPSDPETLQKLPGIGAYTAGAIASIAFGRPVAAVDGNVVRVMSRLYGMSLTQGSVADRGRVAAMIEPLIPPRAPGDFNQSLMELGALICTPVAPRCPSCPLQVDCVAFQSERVHDLPLKPQKKTVVEEPYTVVIVKAGSLLRIQRREQGLLKGLYQFDLLPGRLDSRAVIDWLESEIGIANAQKMAISALPDRIHRFTHRLWHLSGYLVSLEQAQESPAPPAPDPDTGITWVTESDLMRLPFPTALAAYRMDAVGSRPALSRTKPSTSSTGKRKRS